MTTPALPQDPQEVGLKAGALFGTNGIYVTTTGGTAFIPAHCLPDVQRRLTMLGRKLHSLPLAPTLPGLGLPTAAGTGRAVSARLTTARKDRTR